MFLPSASPQKKLADEVARLVHKDQKRAAAEVLVDFMRLPYKFDGDSPAKINPVLSHWLHWLLDNNAPAEAAQLLWTPNLFTPEPQYTKDVWTLFEEAKLGLIMGGASCSKSYGVGVRIFLEWIRDPQFTAVKVIGPSQDHLEANLFSHLVRLHANASLPMPGEVGELFIGLSRRDQSSAIKGVIIPLGQTKKAGRIQGTKRLPRVAPHPIFGPLTRLLIFIDEIENVPMSVWSDIDNVISQASDNAPLGFRLFGAYNPGNMSDEVGKRAEPPFGWGDFDVDKHFKWKSARGWDVLRLDPERCENVVQDRVVFEGLQTRLGLEAIAKNAGGRQSPGYFKMGRGAYPPMGVAMTIIPPGLLHKCRGQFIWHNEPIRVGSNDFALEGGAACCYTLGKWGLSDGIKYPASVEHPNGRIVPFRSRSGQAIQRYGLQVEKQFILPRGDTVAVKNETLKTNRNAGVRPEYFACDRTGNGAGVADLLRYEWGPIQDVNYSQGPTENAKLFIEETQTCEETFDRIHSELWFALRGWMEFQYILFGPEVDMGPLTPQFTQRLFTEPGKKKKIESKKDYKSRGFESPDEADSVTLLVHAARRGSGVTLSMLVDAQSEAGMSGDDGWADEIELRHGARIDVSNRSDYLDDAIL